MWRKVNRQRRFETFMPFLVGCRVVQLFTEAVNGRFALHSAFSMPDVAVWPQTFRRAVALIADMLPASICGELDLFLTFRIASAVFG